MFSFKIIRKLKLLLFDFHITGNREIVGFGVSGHPDYQDRTDTPCPAVRFKEDSPEILALREKEKGDWNSLTLEEKKECM